MSDQDNRQVSTLQHPTTNDPEAWKAYWKAQDQSWRTEPEIDVERQKYLAERRAIVPDIEQGIYPFKDFKLSRADVEWLLATHENGRGSVDWKDENQKERIGLDVRGANLQEVDLSNYNGPRNLDTKRGENKIYSRHDEKTLYRRFQGKSGSGSLERREDISTTGLGV